VRRETHERAFAVLARARAWGLSPQAVEWLERAASGLAGDDPGRGTAALAHAHAAYDRLRLGLESEAEELLCPLAVALIELARAEQYRAAAETRLERTLALYEAARGER